MTGSQMVFKASVPIVARTVAGLFLLQFVTNDSVWGAEETAAVATAATPLAEMLPELHLLEPIWRSKTVRRESVLFVSEEADHPATGKLLFPVTTILAIHSADGRTQFELGKDVELAPDGRTLILLKDSRIPRLKASELFLPAGAPHSIPHKTGDPAKHLLFDNGHWFHDQQSEITYEHNAVTWPGPMPEFSGERLPKVLAKLRAGKPVTLAVSGDSIAAGGNASGTTKTPPQMPAFPELVAAQLESTYKSDITLQNRAVGGWTAAQGASDLDASLAAKPDLVIIAYGMNDVGYRDPVKFGNTISGILDRIHKANPDTEVILVAPMTGHAEWVHTPPEMFPLYRNALASLSGPGVALSDVTSLWQEMLSHKREIDLTGNGVNHPNDFGHRLYAQAILALLVEPTTID